MRPCMWGNYKSVSHTREVCRRGFSPRQVSERYALALRILFEFCRGCAPIGTSPEKVRSFVGSRPLRLYFRGTQTTYGHTIECLTKGIGVTDFLLHVRRCPEWIFGYHE